MRKLRNEKGYTEAELMMVFALLALFGILCFALIQAGAGAYDRLSENQSGKSFARITLSYIENRVRLGDEKDSVTIVMHPEDSKKSALVISGITDVEGESIWIMQREGELVEYYVMDGEQIDLNNYLKIGDIYDFNIEQVGNSLRIEVAYLANNIAKSQIKIINLRSGGAR